MQCPLCKTKMEAHVELTGGCSGHDDDCRCYCDSADVHVEFVCPNSEKWAWKDYRGKRNWVLNKNCCKQPNLKIGELSCQESMARWFTEHYVSPIYDVSDPG